MHPESCPGASHELLVASQRCTPLGPAVLLTSVPLATHLHLHLMSTSEVTSVSVHVKPDVHKIAMLRLIDMFMLLCLWY